MKPRRKIRKSILISFGLLLVVFLVFLGFKLSENGVFTVIDYAKDPQEVATYRHFIFAKRKMNALDDSQVCIKNQDGKVVAIKSGLVNFNTKDVSENTTYTQENGEEGYLNGHYGSDGLYIETNDDGTQVLFQMAGVKGWVDIEDINLLVYDPAYPISSYSKVNDSLVHQISTDFLNYEIQAYGIGYAPAFMEEGTTYYSYDGHYFYSDFESMSQDVRSNVHTNAINTEPYFNFYQYVPHRSMSRISSVRYDSFLFEQKGINALATAYPCEENQSVLFNQQELFINNQNAIHMNGAMMFSLGCNESGYGQSQYAIEQHNIFGHNAFDSDPDQATMYQDLNDCIYQHAYYFLQEGYANPDDWRYHGSWFGDKASGINVQYASDPYWGEKAASMYYHLDQGVDSSQISIVTTITQQELPVKDEDGQVLYSYPKNSIASFVVISQEGNTYEVVPEAPIKDGKIDPSISFTPHMRGFVTF